MSGVMARVRRTIDPARMEDSSRPINPAGRVRVPGDPPPITTSGNVYLCRRDNPTVGSPTSGPTSKRFNKPSMIPTRRGGCAGSAQELGRKWMGRAPRKRQMCDPYEWRVGTGFSHSFNPALGVPVGERIATRTSRFSPGLRRSSSGRKLNRGHIDSNLKMEAQ